MNASNYLIIVTIMAVGSVLFLLYVAGVFVRQRSTLDVIFGRIAANRDGQVRMIDGLGLVAQYEFMGGRAQVSFSARGAKGSRAKVLRWRVERAGLPTEGVILRWRTPDTEIVRIKNYQHMVLPEKLKQRFIGFVALGMPAARRDALLAALMKVADDLVELDPETELALHSGAMAFRWRVPIPSQDVFLEAVRLSEEIASVVLNRLPAAPSAGAKVAKVETLVPAT